MDIFLMFFLLFLAHTEAALLPSSADIQRNYIEPEMKSTLPLTNTSCN
jgi:hypothetical protein